MGCPSVVVPLSLKYFSSIKDMAQLLDIVKKGSTDRSVAVRIIDSTDGTPETGVVYNTSGIDLWYRREGAALASITEATLAALTTAHADGGFLAVGNGEYRLDLPDAAVATGANYVDIGGTVTGMIVIGGRVRLVDFDLESTLGMQRKGTAAAISSGTLTLASAHGISASASILIVLTGGTDAVGKSRIGTYSGSGNVFNVSPAWNANGETTPSDTITYEIYPIPLGSTSAPPTVLVSVGTGTGQINLSNGKVPATIASGDYSGDTPQTGDSFARIGATGSGLTSIASATNLATAAGYIDTEVAAIKAKTDQLIFTKANELDANAQSINGVTVTGDGSSGNKFGV